MTRECQQNCHTDDENDARSDQHRQRGIAETACSQVDYLQTADGNLPSAVLVPDTHVRSTQSQLQAEDLCLLGGEFLFCQQSLVFQNRKLLNLDQLFVKAGGA